MNNPVAWQIWSEESLDLAKQHNRLIFLSIGYAACHCMPQFMTSLSMEFQTLGTG